MFKSNNYYDRYKRHYKVKKDIKRNSYLLQINKLKKTIPEWDNFFCNNPQKSIEENDQIRGSNWIRLEVIGQSLLEKFSWAIPDERSLRILSNYSPLIEIGAGKGYWAKMLSNRNVDIIAFDKNVDKNRWYNVLQGNSNILKTSIAKGRNLFLCYPDDSQNLALKCLQRYQGEYIIHVGELITTGTISGYPQAPWGRTSSSEFTVALLESFHCILSASIPRFPFSNDYITIWKRTLYIEGRNNNTNTDTKKYMKKKELNYWASIPKEERLIMDIAAPCVQHLLSE